MARIRTIKPEMFTSETLASVSVTAERTFTGLLTQADDQGRHRDNAAVITGLLWPLRPEHTPVHVENDLQQLADARLICRYVGDDGKRYLHLVGWDRHQKINRPSASRLPACPAHHDAPRTGSASPHGAFTEPSNAQKARFAPDASPAPPHVAPQRDAQPVLDDHTSVDQQESADQGPGGLDSVSPHGGLTENSPPGSRILDPGSFLTEGASAPAPTPSAPQLVAEYVNACRTRPPQRHLARLGKETKNLLAEGIGPAHIRAGLARLRSKGLDPSVLPSVVNEAMNADQPASSPHRPWTNPADVEAAYGGDL